MDMYHKTGDGGPSFTRLLMDIEHLNLGMRLRVFVYVCVSVCVCVCEYVSVCIMCVSTYNCVTFLLCA